MEKYLRFVNPLVAAAGLGLCMHGGYLFVQDKWDGLYLSVYLLAKGLFGGFGLLILGVTANELLGFGRRRGSGVPPAKAIGWYLRWANPVVSLLVLALCLLSCRLSMAGKGTGEFEAYLLAKGLFCSLSLLLAGVIAERMLSGRTGQACSHAKSRFLRLGPPTVSAIVLCLCTFTSVQWGDGEGFGDLLVATWGYYFLGSGLFCGGTLLLLGWLASYTCGMRPVGAKTLRLLRVYLRWGNPLLAVVTLLLCTYAGVLWAFTPDEWMFPWLYFQARGLLNGACLLALGVIAERVLLHAAVTMPDSGEKEAAA